jgi:hypothetical protein
MQSLENDFPLIPFQRRKPYGKSKHYTQMKSLIEIDKNPALSVFNLKGAILPRIQFIGTFLTDGSTLTKNGWFFRGSA